MQLFSELSAVVTSALQILSLGTDFFVSAHSSFFTVVLFSFVRMWVIYLRYEHDNGVHCKLIASNTSVAPTTKQMIRRLELLSCLVSARLKENVRKALMFVDDVSHPCNCS